MNIKYKIVFLFIAVILHSQNNKAAVFFKGMNNLESKKNLIVFSYIKIAEEMFLENKIKLDIFNEQLEYIDVSKISESLRNNYNYFFIYDVFQDTMSVKYYSNFGKLLYNFEQKLDYTSFSENIINKDSDVFIDYKKKIDDIIKNFDRKDDVFYKVEKSNIKVFTERDFPFFNLCVSGLSYKLYYDDRKNMFGLFPINFIATFFPLRYLEVGFFYRIGYNSGLFRYYDFDNDKFRVNQFLFDMDYGLFCGFSLFYEKQHYSIGVSFFNKYYVLSESEDWTKKESITNYFLPQFSIYQRLDINLYKNISYTMYINVKTTQNYFLRNNIFYAETFNYNLFILELSLMGFSITF